MRRVSGGAKARIGRNRGQKGLGDGGMGGWGGSTVMVQCIVNRDARERVAGEIFGANCEWGNKGRTQLDGRVRKIHVELRHFVGRV